MRKSAFLGSLVRAPFRMAGNLTNHAAGSTVDVLRRGASNNPMGFAMGAAMGVPSAMTLTNPLTTPDNLARGYAQRSLVAQTQEPAMKLGMMLFLPDHTKTAGLKAALARCGMKKTAAPRGRFGAAKDAVADVGGNFLEKLLGAGKRAPKPNPEADFSTPAHVLKTMGTLAAAGVGVGIGQQVAGRLAGKAEERYRTIGRGDRYKKMIKVDPSLADNPRAREYFALIDRASPYISSEPLVAAGVVQSMIDTPSLRDGGPPTISPKILQEILKTEEGRQGTRSPVTSATVRTPELKSNVNGIRL